jgi:epoxyqueuosine reductase
MMTVNDLKSKFQDQFDLVGIIHSKRYFEAMRLKEKDVPYTPYETMVVLGLAYPKRLLRHSKTHLVPSFYTFGKDYHLVLKAKIEKVMSKISLPYRCGVDNHPHDERTAAILSGLGYFANNQLIINKKYGSYFFLGIVWIDMSIEHEVILEIDDDCGTCKKCIEACPVNALEIGQFHIERCMSYYNQMKKELSIEQVKANYCLFGCDICQLVCPKNVSIDTKIHPEFLNIDKAYVSIVDLFTLSNKQFSEKYNEMAYLWKGKTVLMRNALMVLLRQKNTDYLDLIEQSIQKHESAWYKKTALYVLDELKKLEK